MIFTRLKLHNLYAFSDAEINLSFPRKLTSSPLGGENLCGRPKFYYRKVCIITGSNASGKTSLGRILLGIQNFLSRKNLHLPELSLNDKANPAFFDVDFVTSNFCHHRLYLNFSLDNSGVLVVNEIKYAAVFINENDSCSKTTRMLDGFFNGENENNILYHFHKIAEYGEGLTLEEFKKYKFNGGWNYLLSENKEEVSELTDLNKNVLDKILRTFDPSIKSVNEMKEVNDETRTEVLNGFSIRFMNGDNVIVTKSGEVANSDRLSRGTYEAVELSHFLSSLFKDFSTPEKEDTHACIVYFLDERMAYVHSELERAIITLAISKLCMNSQFFYTTHNSDIFKLDLPAHSYIFLKKDDEGSVFIDASSELKKNDRSLAKYVENDVFNTLPDMALIEELF